MKTLKSIMLGLAMLTFCGAVNANTRDNDTLTKTYAINTFVDAMIRGKLNGLNNVLDKSAEFSVVHGNKVMSFNKKQMLEYFQTTKNTEQMCTTSTSLVESTASIAIVKMDMKYDGFTRSNYVTIANTGNGWKITNIYSVFS